MDRPGDALSQTARVVCRRCNNEWMSELQSVAKPILLPLVLGEWGEISAKEREIVARWASMFNMVLDASEPTHEAIIPEQRHEFYQTQKPLPEWIIWVGRLEPLVMTAQAIHTHLWFGDEISTEGI
jgi:hypothetical protein